jgi:TldD protein
MPTTRRHFLAASGLASAGLVVPGATAWAMPRGAKTPAPKSPPTSAAGASLSASPVAGLGALAQMAVDRARAAKATYADARIVQWQSQRVGVRDERVFSVSSRTDTGIGVRVLVDGAWGFAATDDLSEASVQAATQRALEAAKVGAKLRRDVGAPPIELASAAAVVQTWVAPHEVDPRDVSARDKADLLLAASKAALGVAGVRHVDASVHTIVEDKLLVTSGGTTLHQLLFRVAPSLTATAVHPRLGFASRDHEAAPMLAGWEYVESLDLSADAPQVGLEAVQKLHAPRVVPGRRHVILAPSNLWLTIHESIGHPTELDRAMGFEADFAGTSFISPDDTGKLKIGSDIVTLYADRTQPGGLATTGWDDEGVAAQRWPIVDKGTFVGWQTTRDQAGWIGEKASRGCAYGEKYSGVAFQRMPNVSLQPGTEGYTTEDLINATDEGVYVTGRGSWSIDQQRYNFQFSGQTFWHVKHGRIVSPLRDVAYQANTVEFWSSCDMIGGKGTYRLGGSLGDGKGQPGQSNSVSHGCPPARFMANLIDPGANR